MDGRQMKWGIFENGMVKGQVHVIPCDDEGKILDPHEVYHPCPCQPYRDDRQSNMIIHIHEDRSERG